MPAQRQAGRPTHLGAATNRRNNRRGPRKSRVALGGQDPLIHIDYGDEMALAE
ncbi:MAG: hypothetical protein Q8P22_12205 [Chloroflexota bacterium]|nr:hypothetical protein [Chloroflexota bacterium]